MLKDITLSILHDVVMKAIKSSDCHSIIHQSYRRKGEHHRIDEYLGGNTAPEFGEDIVFYYRKIYYEALDSITNAIQIIC